MSIINAVENICMCYLWKTNKTVRLNTYDIRFKKPLDHVIFYLIL